MLFNLMFFDCNTTLVTFATLLLLCWLWFKKTTHLPPGPLGVPIFGVLPFLCKHPEKDFAKWSKRYGSLMSLRLGCQDWIVLNDYDVIVEALVKQSHAFHGRPSVEFFEECMGSKLGIVFSHGGQRWKLFRRFTEKKLKLIRKQGLEALIMEELDDCVEEIQNKNGKPFDVQEILTHAISNIISSLVYGQRFCRDDEIFKQLQSYIKESFDLSSTWLTPLMSIFPELCRIPFPPFSTHVKRFKKVMTCINDIIANMICQHLSTFSSDESRGLLDVYFKEFKHNANTEKIMLQDAMPLFRELFITGSTTTSITLRWGMLCMAKYQEKQQKCQKEIDEVLGPHKTPDMAQRIHMPYLRAAIQEILRFRTTAPLGLPRKTTKDVKIREYIIPKDTNVFMNTWALHNDDKFWNTPEQFLPERHLNEEGNFVKSSHVMPFMAGARTCVGQEIAKMELFLVLAVLLQKFSITFGKNPPSLHKGTFGSMHAPLPFDIVMKQR